MGVTFLKWHIFISLAVKKCSLVYHSFLIRHMLLGIEDNWYSNLVNNVAINIKMQVPFSDYCFHLQWIPQNGIIELYAISIYTYAYKYAYSYIFCRTRNWPQGLTLWGKYYEELHSLFPSFIYFLGISILFSTDAVSIYIILVENLGVDREWGIMICLAGRAGLTSKMGPD